MGGKTSTDLTRHVKGITVHGKSLRITFQYKGKRERETLHLEPTKANVTYASRLRAAILLDIEKGCFDYGKYFPESKKANREDSPSKKASITVGELCEKYIQLKNTDIGVQTERVYENSLNQCVSALGKERMFSSITSEDILEMRNTLVATRKASTVNTYLVIFRGFLEFALNNCYTDLSLFDFAKKFKTSCNDPDPFEIEEYNQLIESSRYQEDKNWIAVAVYTGLRTGELCSLAWEDVDFRNNTLTVRRTITHNRLFKLPKTYEQRTVMLMPPAIEALKDQQRKTYFMPPVDIDIYQVDKTQKKTVSVRPVFRPGVVTRNGSEYFENWYTVITLRGRWLGIIERSGVRYRTQYQTRHTFACWNITSHGNLAFISKQMGHKDLTMLTKVYGKWMDSSSKDEVASLWLRMTQKGHNANQSKMSQKWPKELP